MDPTELTAVKEWPQPETRKELQRFLGFANFYRRFIHDYSEVTAPLTALISTARYFVWTPEATKAGPQSPVHCRSQRLALAAPWTPCARDFGGPLGHL